MEAITKRDIQILKGSTNIRFRFNSREDSIHQIVARKEANDEAYGLIVGEVALSVDGYVEDYEAMRNGDDSRAYRCFHYVNNGYQNAAAAAWIDSLKEGDTIMLKWEPTCYTFTGDDAHSTAAREAGINVQRLTLTIRRERGTYRELEFLIEARMTFGNNWSNMIDVY